MGKIIRAGEEHFNFFLQMGAELWNDYTLEELSDQLMPILQSEKNRVLLYYHNDEPIAFLYLSIRTDYVEGSDSSPTGYVEGIYVKPAFRRSGISTKLLAEGEQWIREMGCTQIGSDIYLNNQVSYDFHIHSGFKEAARLITFIKNI